MTTKTAFILMPFAEEFVDVYEQFISESLKTAGYEVHRADDIRSQNNIISDIVSGIATSHLVVADLTGANPNVYYEVGIAHALDKNVLLLAQDIDDVPFDLRPYKIISYSTHFAKMQSAKDELIELATLAYNEKLPFGNPVKDYLKLRPSNEKRTSSPEQPSTTDSANTVSTLNYEVELNEELGFLDYGTDMEEGLESITMIVSEIGSKLGDDLTPKIHSSTEKLVSTSLSNGEKRRIVKDLSTSMQDFTKLLKEKNILYRSSLNKLENSLEYMLNDKIDLENEDAITGLSDFITSFESTEQATYAGRDSFVNLISIMNELPPIERSFNREKSFMVMELETFVDNLDLTISVIARGTHLAKSLLNNT